MLNLNRCSRRACMLHSLVGLAAIPAGAIAQELKPRSPGQLLQERILDANSLAMSETIDLLSVCRTFAQLLKLSGLANSLDARPNLTAFIPHDKFWPTSLNLTEITQNKAKQLVLRHLILQRWAAVAQPIRSYKTLGGGSISVEVAQINQLGFERQGLRVRNGYIHLIQGVL